MNEPLNYDGLDPGWHASDWLDAKNVSGMVIPAHAVVMASDANVLTDTKEYFIEIDQYDESNDLIYVNSNKSVGTESPFTEVSKVWPQLALYNTATTPAIGEEWGPVSGSWRLGPTGSGFIILGVIDSTEGIALVENRISGTSCDYIKFTIISTDEECTYATVSIDHIPCSCSVVPEDYNGTVDAYDVDCMFSGIAKPDLIGLQGSAQYTKPYDSATCKWVIEHLCCPNDGCA